MSRRAVSACLASAVLVVLSLPNAAAAYSTTTIEQQIEGVTQAAYQQSDVTTALPECNQTCQNLVRDENALLPDLPESKKVAGELRKLRLRAGLKFGFRLFGTAGLVIGAGQAGWWIGSGIRTMWEGAELPSVQSPTTVWIVAKETGDSLISKCTTASIGPQVCGQIRAPGPGWLVAAWDDTSQSRPPAEQIPEGAEELKAPSGVHYVLDGRCCAAKVGGELHALWLKLEYAFPPSPARPNYLPGTPLRGPFSVPDPGFNAAKEKILDELKNHPEDYPNAGPHISEGTGGPDESPTSDKQWEKCRLSSPDETPPPSSYDPWDVREAFFRIHEDGTTKTTYLRNGRVDTATRRGWGYYKIAVKHGWSQEDRTATAVALLRPPTTVEDTTREYTGPVYTGVDGVQCFRRVVVQTAAKSSDPPGKPKEIISSYGRLVP